jgi:hypothetical protein
MLQTEKSFAACRAMPSLRPCTYLQAPLPILLRRARPVRTPSANSEKVDMGHVRFVREIRCQGAPREDGLIAFNRIRHKTDRPNMSDYQSSIQLRVRI